MALGDAVDTKASHGGARAGAGRKPVPRVRLSFDLPPEAAERLRAEALAQGESVRAFVRALVLARLSQNNKEL